MDEATEYWLWNWRNYTKSIDELLKGSTILTVAHRIKTIIKYDKILCINQGKIEDFDSPDNLLKKKNDFLWIIIY